MRRVEMQRNNSKLSSPLSTLGKRLGVGATALVAAMGIGMVTSTTALGASCENPDSLTFAMIPTEESVAELQLYQPVTERLAKLTGKKIEFFMPTSYASVVEGLLSKFVDVAVLGPYSYVIANRKDENIEVFATYAKKPGYLQEEGPGYKGVLISKKGSGFKTIEDLKGTLIGLTDPGSTSGNLVPRVVFAKVVNMDFDDYFKKSVYTGSHELSTIAVHQGKVDAAFVASHRFDNVVAKGDVKLEDFNIIWSSPAIPQDPFVYRSLLCEDIKANIRETFLGLKDDPSAKAFLENVKSNTFVSMTSEDYDVIRDLKKAKDAK
jgi:phosphonate transport system substrate-binding protein